MTPDQRVGAVDPRELIDARLCLHWAAQIPAAVGHLLAKEEADDSQSSFVWDREHRALVGRPLGRSGALRVGIRPATLELIVLDESSSTLNSIPLEGRTVSDAIAWMEKALEDLGVPSTHLRLRSYEMPNHPVRSGSAFSPEPRAHFEELAGWFALAAASLEQFAAEHRSASEVRCWPHHFDIATLLTLPDGSTDERGNPLESVSIGFSPGDVSYGEPYLYVTPWPSAKEPPDVDLASGGHWHHQGFQAAVLLGSRLAEAKDPALQRERIRAFVRSSLAPFNL